MHIGKETIGKRNTPQSNYIKLFNEIMDQPKNYTKLYTDGSQNEENNGCAVVHDEEEYLYKLP